MLSTKIILYLLTGLSLTSVMQSSRQRFDLIVHNASCRILSSTMKKFDCDCTMLKRGNYVGNMAFMYNKNLASNAEWHAIINIIHSHLKTAKPFKYLDVRVNVCKFLSATMHLPILRMFLDEVRETSNLPFKCPLKKNYLYSISNYTILSEYLPPYTPLVQFNLTLNTYDNRRPIAKLFAMGATVKRS
ncbi:uncharacterized protein LOC131997959 [Stomoxys calcitrans]|uniref:uncharacterized protein LOC131997959 n=1 Tax=Stomoxys calcitrans TaxID=35570 RepID=UPI0027E2511F|nr:uncharacterized protein LOC131997959 [Stomoxys calcitrans]